MLDIQQKNKNLEHKLFIGKIIEQTIIDENLKLNQFKVCKQLLYVYICRHSKNDKNYSEILIKNWTKKDRGTGWAEENIFSGYVIYV